MYRREVNERSPMRVLEKSIGAASDGTKRGLGRGNVGVVAAKAGVGKTPLLVHIALDALLCGKRVLHVSHEHPVDHVRAFYDEIFRDLAASSSLARPEDVKVDLERHRLIFSLMASSSATSAPPRSSVAKILETLAFARDVAQLRPDVVVVDGLDVALAGEEGIGALAAYARSHEAELWLSSFVEIAGSEPASGEFPAPLDRAAKDLAVVVYLQPEHDVVRLRLLKDHDAKEPATLGLRLDPHTFRVVDEDGEAPAASPDPRRFKLVSGGMKGAEAEFGACAQRWGLEEVNYTFDGHLLLERQRGLVQLSSAELARGDFSLVNASRRLRRPLSDIPLVRSILQTIWHQISEASEVFVVGAIQEDGTVRGGTGWGAELARLWKKPLFVFDQSKRAWHRWNGDAWESAGEPTITRSSFAGIGTQALDANGRAAIHELFTRSFGKV